MQREFNQVALGDGEISAPGSVTGSELAGAALEQPGPEVDGDGEAIAAAIWASPSSLVNAAPTATSTILPERLS